MFYTKTAIPMNQDKTFTEKFNYRYTKNYKARNKNFKRGMKNTNFQP